MEAVPSPRSKKVLGLVPTRTFLWGVYMFSPVLRENDVRLAGDSELSVGVSVSAAACLSLSVGPEMNW